MRNDAARLPVKKQRPSSPGLSRPGLQVWTLSLEPTWQWASEPGLLLLCGAVGWPLSPRAQAGLGVVEGSPAESSEMFGGKGTFP